VLQDQHGYAWVSRGHWLGWSAVGHGLSIRAAQWWGCSHRHRDVGGGDHGAKGDHVDITFTNTRNTGTTGGQASGPTEIRVGSLLATARQEADAANNDTLLC
jgi:hypothetical protein